MQGHLSADVHTTARGRPGPHSRSPKPTAFVLLPQEPRQGHPVADLCEAGGRRAAVVQLPAAVEQQRNEGLPGARQIVPTERGPPPLPHDMVLQSCLLVSGVSPQFFCVGRVHLFGGRTSRVFFFPHATYTKTKVHATYAKEKVRDLRFFSALDLRFPLSAFVCLVSAPL